MELIERLMNSTLFRQTQQAVEREDLLARQALHDELMSTKGLRQAHVDAHQKPIADALASEKKKAAAHEEATALRVTRERELRALLAADDMQIANLERQLRASADPRILEARERLSEKYRAACVRGPLKDDVPTGKRDEFGNPIFETHSNVRAIHRILVALKAARERLDALTIEAGDVPAAIATIEASVPWGDLSVLEPSTAA